MDNEVITINYTKEYISERSQELKTKIFSNFILQPEIDSLIEELIDLQNHCHHEYDDDNVCMFCSAVREN